MRNLGKRSEILTEAVLYSISNTLPCWLQTVLCCWLGSILLVMSHQKSHSNIRNF